MLLRKVVDELLDENRFAHAGATEEARFAASDVGLEQVDRLDAGLEDLRLGGELVEVRRGVMDGIVILHLGHGLAVHRLTQHVPHAAERLRTDGHLHGLAGVVGDKAALQTVGRGHGNAAGNAAGKLALHLENRAHVPHGRRGLDGKCVVDAGHLGGELNVHDSADDAHDAPLTR